jgi:hypothetical protein
MFVRAALTIQIGRYSTLRNSLLRLYCGKMRGKITIRISEQKIKVTAKNHNIIDFVPPEVSRIQWIIFFFFKNPTSLISSVDCIELTKLKMKFKMVTIPSEHLYKSNYFLFLLSILFSQQYCNQINYQNTPESLQQTNSITLKHFECGKYRSTHPHVFQALDSDENWMFSALWVLDFVLYSPGRVHSALVERQQIGDRPFQAD